MKSKLLPRSGKGHSLPRDQVQEFMLQVKERARKTNALTSFNLCASIYACSIILLYYTTTIIMIGNYPVIANIHALKVPSDY